MAEKDKIELIIEAKVKDALANLNKFQQEAERSSSSASGGFTKFKNAIFSVNGVIAGVLAGSVVALGKKLVGLSAQAEQTQVAFTTFLGSAEKARKVIGQLNQFSAVTPFEPVKVQEAAKTLLAFGFQADELMPTLKMLGDVSSGTGKDFKELAVIFGQIKGSGRLMGQDLLQLINAGFNPLQVMSEKTGKSMADLKKEMEQGKISFEDVTAAFKDATSEGGLFFNMMENQSKTLAGRISTLTGNLTFLGTAIGDVLAPVVGQVVDLMNGWVTAILGTDNAFKKQKEQLIDQQMNTNAYMEILKDATSSEESRKKALFEVNKELDRMGIENVDLNTSLSDLVETQNKLNQAFLDEINILAQKEVLQDRVNKAAKAQKIVVEEEFAIRKQEQVLKDQINKGDLVAAAFTKADIAVRRSRLGLNKQIVANMNDEVAALRDIGISLDQISGGSDTVSVGVSKPVATGGGGGASVSGGSIPTTQPVVDNEKLTFDERLKNAQNFYSQYYGMASDFTNAIMALKSAETEQAIQKNNAYYDSLIEAAEGNEEKIKELQDARDKENARIKTEAAKREKKSAVAFAMLQIPLAIASAYAQAFGGPASKAIAASVAGITAGINAAAVKAEPIPVFATGGSLVTKGPQLFLAGDNAGGSERIDIQPLSGPQRGGSGGNVYNFHGIRSIAEARNELIRLEGAGAFQ